MELAQPEGLGCPGAPACPSELAGRGREASQRAQVVLRGEATQEADAPERFHVGGRRGNAPLEVDLRSWR
jgi:hypothetical protein